MKKTLLYIAILSIGLTACREEEQAEPTGSPAPVPASPTAYNLQLPAHFVYISPPDIPQDNPLTVEGIALGRKLFFEKKLSKNNSISCASCHNPDFAFNDKGKALSLGADGLPGLRNAMPLFNLAFTKKFSSHGSFNWHGTAKSIEEQAFGPVKDPLEMADSWPNVASKLSQEPGYPSLFEAAFGSPAIDSNAVVRALAQFERTLISGASKADNEIKKRLGDPYVGAALNAQERRGYDVFVQENKGDCTHCHGSFPNPLWTDFEFRNNGLDANPDSGLAQVNKRSTDLGKFKTPSLRNLVFTAPYMHDGRHQTLEQVINFYADSVEFSSPNLDPIMLKNRNLDQFDRADLLAFLKAITDSAFVQNPNFKEP